MEIQTTTSPDGSTHKHYIFAEDEVAVLTGPVSGIKTLSDGTTVNVTDEYVAVSSQEHADELVHLIALEHVEKGNPNDVDVLADPETGQLVHVQRPFVYEAPDGETHVGVGTPQGEHPLDEANGITTDSADPRALTAVSTKKKGS